MITKNLIVFALLLFALLSDCVTLDPAQTEKNYTISVYSDANIFDEKKLDNTKIAFIKISEDGNILLEPAQGYEASSEYMRLKYSVEEIRMLDSLELTYEDIETINGQEALVMKVMEVQKSDPNYIYAVREELTLKHGFKCEIE